ncbi:hypothetical protein AB0N07_40965 [Streptomyces sp. NPDC051172]|uniref:WXG100 family type VII secretion target n=1 Tax=Streptomyces sp. NPDC051172 TaxID=3155796 RepID=UPI0034132293
MSSDGKKSDGYAYEYVPAAMCYDEQATTPFADLNMDQMKTMVINAKPGVVHDVARGWRKVNDDLVGEDGGGGSRQDFLAAVHGVLEHWEGEAADRFKARAAVIAQKMQDGAQYAQYTSIALGSAATVLETIKPEVEAMEKPGTISSGLDFVGDGFSHDDSGYQADKRAGMSTQEALDKNKDDLSAGKEAQLKMAVKMEQLGAAYASQTKAMGTWNRRPFDDSDDYPGEPGGTAPVPIVAIPTESGPRLVGRTSTGSGASSGSGRSTITASPSTPHRVAGAGTGSSSKASAPSGVGTDIDGLATTSPGGTGAGDGGGHGGGGTARVGGAGGGSGTGAGLPGVPGGPAGGLARGGSASGEGSAAGSGRTGVGGVGAGTGAGAGRRGNQPSGRGPLARTKGGVIGEPEDAPSTGTRAGSGLHGSRGGTTEGRRAAGLTGSGQAGVAGQGRGKKKKDGKPVPGYLVEDEETWVPKRDDTTPPLIE